MDGRLTISEVAKALKITPRTLMRWEKTGKIKKSKRDWRGWRFYSRDDLDEIRKFYEGTYEYQGKERITPGNLLGNTIVALLAVTLLAFSGSVPLNAETLTPDSHPGIRETSRSVDIVLDELPAVDTPQAGISESLKYTLGTNDIISIEVRRHPEFSGKYTVNSEGKIGYKYIGDILVDGLTKNELKDRMTGILSDFLIKPEVDVQIVAYLSKVIYVVGDVHRPGKFYMRGDTIFAREAFVQAGLPTQAAALRGCRVITPDRTGKDNYRKLDAHRLLYDGDLKQNLVMKPGDVLYVPATFMAKVIRVISPVTNVVGQAAGVAAKGAALAL